jgi:hypothetical protein
MYWYVGTLRLYGPTGDRVSLSTRAHATPRIAATTLRLLVKLVLAHLLAVRVDGESAEEPGGKGDGEEGEDCPGEEDAEVQGDGVLGVEDDLGDVSAARVGVWVG